METQYSENTIGQFLATYFTPIHGYFYLRIFLSVDIFIPRYFYTYLRIFLSADIFICGYFYLRIFLSVDIFIRGYFCNKIKNWCKKSLFHHIYVIKLLLSMLYAFKADILHSIFKFLILLQKYPRIKISTDKNIRR